MEQIAAFVLGVSAVTFIWVVAVAFRTANLAKQNEESIRNVEGWIERNDELINRRIDREVDRVNNLHTDSISFTDSRVDKLEAKLTSISKEILKG